MQDDALLLTKAPFRRWCGSATGKHSRFAAGWWLLKRCSVFNSVSRQTHADVVALFDPAPPTQHHHRMQRAANQHDRQLKEERPGSPTWHRCRAS